MNPIIIMGVVMAFMAAGLVGEGYVIKGKSDTIQAKQDEIDKTWKVENKALGAKLDLANGEIENVHAMMDSIDTQARAAKASQQKQALELASKLQAATDEKDALFALYQEEIDARPEIVTVGGAIAPEAWDSVVADGMLALRCQQLRDAAGAGGAGDVPDCGLQNNHGPSGSRLAGDPTGTAGPYPRPSAKQQLVFLEFAWSLRRWGKSCYDDKRAIAASQAVQP
jgi:hypothetical protein